MACSETNASVKSYHEPPSPIHPRSSLPFRSPPSSQVALTFSAWKRRCFRGRFRGLHRSERRRGFSAWRHERGWKHEDYRGRLHGRAAACVCGDDSGRGADPCAGAAPPGERLSGRCQLRRLRRRLRPCRPFLLQREAARMAELSRGTPDATLRIQVWLRRALDAVVPIFPGVVQGASLHRVRRRGIDEMRLRRVRLADWMWLPGSVNEREKTRPGSPKPSPSQL